MRGDNTIITSQTDGIFAGNTTLKEITIPANIQYMNGYDFYGCTALEKVTFAKTSAVLDGETPQYTEAQLINWDLQNDSNQYIRTNNFYGCTAIKEIDLSPLIQLRIIGSSFKNNHTSDGVPSITTLTYNGNSNYHTNSDGTQKLLSAIPPSITYITSNAFYTSLNVKGLVIPSSVGYLGQDAFRTSGYNNGLKYIRIEMNENSTINNPMQYNQQLCAIHFTNQTPPLLTTAGEIPLINYMSSIKAIVVSDETAKTNYKNASSWQTLGNNFTNSTMYNALGKTSETCSPAMLVITEAEWETAKTNGYLVVTNLTDGTTSHVSVAKTCEDI